MTGALPRRCRGRQTASARAAYQEERAAFCRTILQIRSTLDFEVSARGWAYIFENRRVITKEEIDACQDLINECRKTGELPIDICAVDETRAFDCLEQIDGKSPESEARDIVNYIDTAHLHYQPHSFWEFQDFYIQMMVEKIDLKSLFAPVCREFHIPIANAKGWADINMRAAMMARFGEWESKGKKPVLLYCGDHDPAGLNISAAIRQNLADMVGAVGWPPDSLVIERFGLNHDFIVEQGLTWIDNLVTGSGGQLDDPRHPDHRKPYVQDYIARYGVRKVEANALVVSPEAGRRLCRDAILRYVDPNRISDFKAATEGAQALVAEEIARLIGAV